MLHIKENRRTKLRRKHYLTPHQPKLNLVKYYDGIYMYIFKRKKREREKKKAIPIHEEFKKKLIQLIKNYMI